MDQAPMRGGYAVTYKKKSDLVERDLLQDGSASRYICLEIDFEL